MNDMSAFPVFTEFFEPAPDLLISLNIGGTFDIPTGTWVKGKYGENILNGGLAQITAVGAKPNAYKTTTCMYKALAAAARYTSQTLLQDTENIFDKSRMDQIAQQIEGWDKIPPSACPQIMLIDGNTQIGTWWTKIKAFGEMKIKNRNKITVTCPMMDLKGQPIKMLAPTIVAQDGLSSVGVKEVEDTFDKFDAGDSKTNTTALTRARIISQVLSQISKFTLDNNVYLIFTAQLGTKHQLDPMRPNSKDLSFMKQNEKFKNVPENFNFLMNNLYQFNPASPMYNSSSDKTPKFPKCADDRFNQNTDLQEILGINVRSKKGISGIPFAIAASQTEGFMPALSEFLYLKQHGDWGLEGNAQRYALSLKPDVVMQRTTVRACIESDESLRRALNITCELAQMANLWFDERVKLMVTAKELYDGIKAKGYDWEWLLANTRGWWCFEEQGQAQGKYFLSSMDLLEMYHGLYHPYWMDEKDFTKVKPEFAIK